MAMKIAKCRLGVAQTRALRLRNHSVVRFRGLGASHVGGPQILGWAVV
jgi:hypothetical protein